MKSILVFLFTLVSFGIFAQTPISGLPNASALSGTEPFPIVQSGQTRKATPLQLSVYVNSLYGSGISTWLTTPSWINFQAAITGIAPFWPLGGAADLTASVIIDGNGYGILIGDPNPLNSFELSVLDNFHFHSDDGTYHGHIQIANQDPFSHYLSLSFGDSSRIQSITLDNTVVSFAANNGVDNSSILLSPSNTILNLSDAGTFNVRDDAAADMLIVSDGNITIKTALDNQHLELDDITGVDIASDIGLSLVTDDGVDASSFSLTPTTAAFISDEFTHNGESLPLSTTVSISSAEILALNSTPKTLIAAPGAGKFIQIISISASLDFVSSAYATNVDLFFRYASGGPAINSGSMNIAQGADEYFRFGLATDETGTAISSFVNQPVVAQINTGDPTAGDGTIKVYITYRIVDL